MAKKEKKDQSNEAMVQEPAESQGSSFSYNNSNDGQETAEETASLDQEIRLAEAQPGDIEALEAALDEATETSAYQTAHCLAQDKIIEELEETLICLEPVLSLVNQQQIVIKMLMEKLSQPSQPTGFMPRTVDRKAEALALLNPNNRCEWPGPPISITQLAQAMNTNNKNVSSVLTALRDQGYQIATDELGRKFIKAHTPGQSAKTQKFVQYEAAQAQTTISPTELTTLISQAQGTIVKRTAEGITRVN